ncbi:MAG: hypothetical protein WA435_02775 [Gallionellaceae bacterium]
MTKTCGVQVTEITQENMEEVVDQMLELFASGKAVQAVYGFSDNGDDFCIDMETGDVEIKHSDGTVEKIPGTDPRAKTFLDEEE